MDMILVMTTMEMMIAMMTTMEMMMAMMTTMEMMMVIMRMTGYIGHLAFPSGQA